MTLRTSILNLYTKISVSEFYDALLKSWQARGVESGSGQQQLGKYAEPRILSNTDGSLGLALSGGVDSMALATLCRGLQCDTRLKTQFKFSFEAFIVDHKARNGSSEEAHLVSTRVFKLLRVKPTIITLQWPSGLQPSTLPNFESEARRLRYQAIGRACRNRRIQYLLVAHHEDDQAETVLLRLANGHRGIGLQGMKATAEIPECWGMYGVSQSGTSIPVTKKKSGQQQTDSAIAGNESCMVGLADGGITIHRPLLHFPKSRLKMTCSAMGTQWVEDETNYDPTITPRNAVRYLLSSNRLPLLLRKPSLLSLAQHTQEKLKELETAANRLFQNCDIIAFDLRSGRLLVRLPVQMISSKPFPDMHRDRHLIRGQNEAGLLLRKLTELISPQEIVSMQKLKSVAQTIFPDLKGPSYHDGDSASIQADSVLPASFTACGVQFRRLESAIASSPQTWSHLDPSYIWELTRQPYFASSTLPTIHIPPTSPSPTHLGTFHLWDGRYWIRLLNPTVHPHTHNLLIRPLQPSDLEPFRLSLSPARRLALIKLLKEAAPGKVRWTLPAIALLEDGEGAGTGRGRVLALPTLGFVAADWEEEVKWEIQYKKVDLGRGREEGRVVVR
ncbi:MAG: hypothetical protein Q9187_004910 [Circinaria calcarea]